MNPDGGVKLGIRRTHDGCRRTAGGKSGDIDATWVYPVVFHDLPGDAGDQRGLAPIPALVVGVEPVPAFIGIGRRGLSRVGDETAMLLGKRIHAGAGGEVVGRLGTAVQHHDQRHQLAGAAGGDVELVVTRSGRGGESCCFESSAFGQRFGNGAQTGNAVEAAEPTTESADVETGRHVLGGEIAESFGETGGRLGVELAGETGSGLGRSGLGGRAGRGLWVGVVENDRLHVDDGGEPRASVRRFRNIAALEQALDEGRRSHQIAGLGEAGCFGHPEGKSVGHVEIFPCLETDHAGSRGGAVPVSGFRVQAVWRCRRLQAAGRRYLMGSARAALTAALACSAPRTVSEAMAARASSGVTSGAMVASPRTRMSSSCPASRTASRSSRLKCRRPRSTLLRVTAWRTTSACRSIWLRMAVRMKSVRLE